MAELKSKAMARAKKKNSGNLASKAKSRPVNAKAQTVDELQREEGLSSAPMPITTPNIAAQSPPLPPTLLWLRKLATIPALRQRSQG